MKLPIHIILVVGLVCWAPLAQAEDMDCILQQQDAVVGLLNQKNSNVSKTLPAKKYLEGRRLTESLVMKDDTQITYDVGGCAHYSFSFTYENLKNLATDKQGLLTRALLLLQQTPVLEGPNAKNIEILKRAIQREQSGTQKIEKDSLKLTCGDAICVLEIKGKTSLKISYDFAL